MGIFKDLGFKKNSSNEIVSPNSAKFNGKTFAECQTELVNRVKNDVILSTDADGLATITSFATVNKPDFFGDGTNVATYFFDGDAKDANGVYNGTSTGVTYTNGKFAQAGVFNTNTTSYVNANIPASLKVLSPVITISAWLKVSTTSHHIVTIANANQFVCGLSTGSFYIETKLNDGVTNNAKSSGGTSLNYADNLWHHFCGTSDGTTVKFYFDGILASTNSTLNNINGGNGFNGMNIGCMSTNYPASFTNKSIDNVRIFNRALTAAEVTALYNEVVPQNVVTQQIGQNDWYKYRVTAYNITPSAKLFVNGSEQVGTSNADLPDFFGDNTNIATYLMQNNLNDARGNYNAIPTNITYTTGRTNQGALFSSNSSATTNLTIPNVFSISFWIKPTAGIDRTNTIFSFNGDSPTYITGMVTSNTGLSIHRPGVTEVYTPANTLILNTWNHVVLTCSSLTASSNNQKWYVNGVQVSTTVAGGGDFNFGKFYFKPFTGVLDTTRIFNKVLTLTEISKLYTEGAIVYNEVRTDTRQLDVVVTNGSTSQVDIELYTGEVI